MAVTPDPGGLIYGIPLSELAGVHALLQRGSAWARTNRTPLPPALTSRLQDIEATLAAARTAASPGNGQKATGCGASRSGRAQNGFPVTIADVHFLSGTEVALRAGLSNRRVRQLALAGGGGGGRLPGGWVFSLEDVERWLAGRKGQ